MAALLAYLLFLRTAGTAATFNWQPRWRATPSALPPGCERRIPSRRVCLSISAFKATTAELPDIDSAATSGDKVKG